MACYNHITHDGMILVFSDDQRPVTVGTVTENFRGDAATVTGGRSPQHAGSTGRVWVTKDGVSGEYFPGGYGLEWVTI